MYVHVHACGVYKSSCRCGGSCIQLTFVSCSDIGPQHIRHVLCMNRVRGGGGRGRGSGRGSERGSGRGRE